MKKIFSKKNLPLIKSVVHSYKNTSQTYELYYKMRVEDCISRQIPTEIMLLQRGAFAGNTTSMLELARVYYFECTKYFLPHALSWWQRAIRLGYDGARDDVHTYGEQIVQKILCYQDMPSEYANIEMKCAMLAEWYLTELGQIDWSALTDEQRLQRCRILVEKVAPVLKIPTVSVESTPGLSFLYDNGVYGLADGLAHPEGYIELRQEMLCDYERLIEVIFHELGHFVCQRIQEGGEMANQMKLIYGISDERIEKWRTGALGNEMKASEEDPDTLSYGVYLNWAALFANIEV